LQERGRDYFRQELLVQWWAIQRIRANHDWGA